MTLTVLSPAPPRYGRPHVVARCECGVEFVIRSTRASRPYRCSHKPRVIESRPANQPRHVAPVSPLVPVQSIFVPDVRLLGRAIMALIAGPLTATELAARCGIDLDDLHDRAHVLKAHVCALRIGDEYLLFGRWEAWSAIHDARARLLANERGDEEVRRAA